MVLPFGVGIGDVIQVANLTKTVVSELKKTGDAAPEYQVLVNDLENLERILIQINRLKPVKHNLTQLEPMRAAIKACQIPLQSFLDKISKFEELLGTWSFRGRHINGIGRRIQWKVAYKSDVKDLRATLAGHVSVLTLHIVLQSLKSTLAAEGDRAGNFQTLHREIEAQSIILESLNRHQLADPNQHFDIKNALDTITEKLNQSMSLNADNRTNLNGQGRILQSIESRSQIIQFDQGQILRNLHSEIQHIRQNQALGLTGQADLETGEGAHRCQPSSKLTLLLKSLGMLVAASTAVLTYRPPTQVTAESHTPVRPPFGSLLQTTGDEASDFCLARTQPEESSKAGHNSKPLDQRSARQPENYSLPQSIARNDLSTATHNEDRALPDRLHLTKPGTDHAKSSDFIPLRNNTTSASHIHPHLSFIVRVEPLSPDYGSGGQAPRSTKEGFFIPPEELKRGAGPALLLRWMGGRLFQVTADDPLRGVTLPIYRTATVFTQHLDTPHILAVPFDARSENVPGDDHGWRPIAFHHQQIPNTNRCYSYISCGGSETHIAGPGSRHWMPQLLPDWYQSSKPQGKIQAGLIGDLPLLFALAAFSAPPTALDVLLTSLQPGAWNPHRYQYPSGHIPERGMVVTVCFDPQNPNRSNKEELDKLQRGEYGPFYGPERPPPRVPARPSWIEDFHTMSKGAIPIPAQRASEPQRD